MEILPRLSRLLPRLSLLANQLGDFGHISEHGVGVFVDVEPLQLIGCFKEPLSGQPLVFLELRWLFIPVHKLLRKKSVSRLKARTFWP